jgi:hypothetical protein
VRRRRPCVAAGIPAPGDSSRRRGPAISSRDSADIAREDEIAVHLRELRSADAERLAREYPEYRCELEASLMDIEREMAAMTLDSREWRIRVAAVRADLTRMDSIAPGRRRRAWPDHADRVEALVHMHAGMNGRAREQ